jgi:hypothetical protein
MDILNINNIVNLLSKYIPYHHTTDIKPTEILPEGPYNTLYGKKSEVLREEIKDLLETRKGR